MSRKCSCICIFNEILKISHIIYSICILKPFSWTQRNRNLLSSYLQDWVLPLGLLYPHLRKGSWSSMWSSDPLSLAVTFKTRFAARHSQAQHCSGLVNLSHSLHCWEQRGVLSLNPLDASRVSIRLTLPSLPLPRLRQSRLSLDFATGALGSRFIPSWELFFSLIVRKFDHCWNDFLDSETAYWHDREERKWNNY